MNITRRALSHLLASAAAVMIAQPAIAWTHGSAGGGGGITLAAFTFQNTSGSTQSANFVTPIFGHIFKQGDVPTGTYPQFKIGAATLLYSMSVNPTYHADGSLRHAAFMCAVPSSIAGSGTASVTLLNGGSAPAASGRALTDFALGGLDLNVSVDGKSNLTGTWVSNLNDGIASAFSDNYVYMDGPAGKVWRIRADAKQSGSAHGQLTGYWYVAALQSSTGGFLGVRALHRLTQPWYDVSSPALNYRSFTGYRLQNGASVLRDCIGSNFPSINFTWSAGSTMNSTAYGIESGMCGQLTTTGTLPAGLSAGVDYFMSVLTANTFAFSSKAAASTDNGSLVAATNAGTGTHTFTPTPYNSTFGSLWSSGPTAQWDFIQGGGSASADCTVRVQYAQNYWRSTGLMPPFDFTTSVTSNPTYTYFLNTAGPVLRYLEATGERRDLGPIPGWHAKHAITNAAIDEQAVRVSGLVGGHFSICLKKSTTKTIPVVNNNTYSGMPAPDNQFEWVPGGSVLSSFTYPANNASIQGFFEQDTSHLPCFAMWPFMFTGEPQYMDMLAEWANSAVYTRFPVIGSAATADNLNGQRNVIIGSTHYYGIQFGSGSLLRFDAWGMRDVANAATMLPQTNPECAAYSTYFNDLMNDNFAAAVAYIPVLNSFAQTNGIWQFRQAGESNIGDMWATSYYINALSWAVGLSGNANAKTLLNHVVKWPAYVKNEFGIFHNPSYEQNMRSGSANGSPILSADTYYGVTGFHAAWTNGGRFTITSNVSGTGYTLTNGDKFLWDGLADGAGTPPGNFSTFTPYYAVNVSGSQCDLAASPGGTPIVPSNTGSGGAYGIASAPPTTTSIEGSGTVSSGGESYTAMQLGAAKWATAVGATVDASWTSGLQTLWDTSGGTFSADPKYAYVSAL